MLNDFSYHFGWTPSDRLEVPITNNTSNAHLVVEHGFENQAVISFLKKPHHELSSEEQRELLSISYNNLVDWHIQIQSDEVVFTFNRCYPFRIARKEYLSKDNLDILRSEEFENIASKKQSPNLPCLDDALIETISFWKRNLSIELSEFDVSNKQFSTLFNAIIFVRAVEDNYRNSLLQANTDAPSTRVLVDFATSTTSNKTFRQIIWDALHFLEQGNVSQEIINFSDLDIFNSLNDSLLIDLVKDFYRIRHAKPYEYNFSLMSKHALSRIYEKYTGILKHVEESDQLSFFPVLPEENFDRVLGSVYTPQFIARFFARYLREQVSPYSFKRFKILEPSVGSGIFLRTLLESQCDLTQEGVTTELIKQAFSNTTGLDIDPNACHASILSLSLLHLVLTNQLPVKLSIYNSDAISYCQEHPEIKSSFDAAIGNPPFISLVDQTDEMRKQVANFLGEHGKGKLDYYLAFLKIGLDALKPGGYGLFVVPHNFLISESSSGMRKLISSQAWIRCIVDLSGIRVFSDVDTYVILLIFQKKFKLNPEPKAIIAQCQALVSAAFHAILEDREVSAKFYATFKLNQKNFSDSDTWLLLPPSVLSIHQKLKSFPKISEFTDIRVGVQTGSNKVFIVDDEQLPEGEEEAFIPYLSDKEMLPYAVPKGFSQYIFYPYLDGEKLSSAVVMERFPKTWKYLLKNQNILSNRSAVKRKEIEWWQLERPRFDYIKSPKIVTPHLVIRPRFSLDLEGQFAVVRSPIFLLKSINPNNEAEGFGILEGSESSLEDLENVVQNDEISDDEISKELLKYFVAILNSTVCYRYISENASKYGHRYTMLEPLRLLDTPVPDPKNVDPTVFNRLILLVDIRLEALGQRIIQVEKEIDEIVSGLYGLNSDEIMRYQLM